MPLVGVALLVCDRRMVGPMLDPLELLRLAGVRDDVVTDDERIFDGVFDVGTAFCNISGFLYSVLSNVMVVIGVTRGVFNGTLRTVLIEVALFNDERELRKLVREPLRSTSRLLDGVAVSVVFRSELVRRGTIALFDGDAAADLSDRLRSRLSRLRSNRFCTVDLTGVLERFFCGESDFSDDIKLSDLDGFDRRLFVRFGVLLSGWSVYDDVLSLPCDGVSDTRLCVSSKPSSFSS